MSHDLVIRNGTVVDGSGADPFCGDIAVDGEEGIDAQWFGPADLPMIPPSMSIARQLIDDWLERQT